MKQKFLIVLSFFLLVGCQTSIQQPTESFDTPTSFNTSIEFELGETLDSFINDGAQLPSKTKDNQDIIWSVSEGNATIEDNIIHKSSNALEYEPIKLEATIDKQTYRYSRLLLLDPYVAYLISYFSSADDGSEVMKLAYTYNGYIGLNSIKMKRFSLQQLVQNECVILQLYVRKMVLLVS